VISSGAPATDLADPPPLVATVAEPARRGDRARAAARTVVGWLPVGRSLPASDWEARHRGVLWLLVAHIPLIVVYGALWHDSGPADSCPLAVVPAAAVALASVRRWSRLVRSCISSFGLVLCSAVAVHLANGAVEAHFHFFVMIPVIALYEEWLPFGLGVVFVLFEHGVLGTAMPREIYGEHAAAAGHPWTFAAIHAGFFATAAVACLVNWRLHELSREAQNDLTAQLRRRAFVDRLTGLPNRDWLLQEAPPLLTRGEPLAVLLLDVDRFKDVNDALGHDVGDELLRQVARRLDAARAPGEWAMRLGGDEFAVLLTGARAGSAVATAADLRRRVVTDRISLGGVDLDLELSIGVAADPADADAGGTDPSLGTAERLQLLMRRADIAMYAAKRDRGGVRLYHEAEDRHTMERLALLSDLREALYSDQLQLAYQPKIHLSDGSVEGVEALLRWTHPVRGPVPPMDFIPAAEATNLMTPLSYRILGLALTQAAHWITLGHPLRVSVNIPPRTLVEDDFVTVVGAALRSSGVPASLLCLELTETSFMEDPERTLMVIDQLRELGVEMSIDDFGTGYSSLSYLRDLPVGEIKIDKSFVKHLLLRREDAILIEATVGLAHKLGMTVVAEGVEDEKSAAALTRLGVDVAQGYLYSRPLPARDLEAWLGARLAASAPAVAPVTPAEGTASPRPASVDDPRAAPG